MITILQQNGGNGGDGLQNNIDGLNYYYSGGGGGNGYHAQAGHEGKGGGGGGCCHGYGSSTSADVGDGDTLGRNPGGDGVFGEADNTGHGGTNTGGGGGGGHNVGGYYGANGGSGVVIVRYL